MTLSATEVTILGFSLALYIILYVIFLSYLIMNSFKENKLIRLYGSKRTKRTALIVLAVIGGILAVGLVYGYVYLI